jgi:hypothetical protein
MALRPRHRTVVRALAEALLHHDGGPGDEQLDVLVERLDAHIGVVSPTLLRGLLAALDLMRWMPLLMLFAWSTLEGLPVERRVSLLERMERSRLPLVVLPLVAFKTMVSLAFFEDPAELRAMGYPGDHERRRYLAVVS